LTYWLKIAYFSYPLSFGNTTRYVSVGICSEVHSEETKGHAWGYPPVKTESL